MAVTGVTNEQYKEFLKNGGTLVFTIDSEDISSNTEFENYPLIKPFLNIGFEIKPTPMIEIPDFAAQIYVHGDDWSRVITFVYRNDGSIVYKKNSNGQYEATATIPPKD